METVTENVPSDRPGPEVDGGRSIGFSRRRVVAMALGAAVGLTAVNTGVRLASAQDDDGEVSTLGLPLFRTSAALNLRSGASTDDAVLLVIPAGVEVQGSNRYENGYREVTYEATTGWAYDAFLVPLGSTDPTNPPAAIDGTAVVDAATNFRSGPSLNATIIRVLPAGSTVSVSDQITDGFRYSQAGGTNGWIFDLALSPTQQGGDGSQSYAATTTAALNLRSAPNGSIILVMPEGASVTVTGSPSQGFLPVTYNGTSGWASSDFLTRGGETPPPAGVSGLVTTDLNLRAQPSTAAQILTVIPAGSSVTVTGAASAGFLPVVYAGTSGWAAADYIRSGANPDWRTTTDVNFRELPALDARILAVLPAGTGLAYAGTGKKAPEGWGGPFDYGDLRGYVWDAYVVPL